MKRWTSVREPAMIVLAAACAVGVPRVAAPQGATVRACAFRDGRAVRFPGEEVARRSR